jgi:hypothetical protein
MNVLCSIIVMVFVLHIQPTLIYVTELLSTLSRMFYSEGGTHIVAADEHIRT